MFRALFLGPCSFTPRVLVIVLFLALIPFISAQDSTGSVSGNVICNDGNAPARGADVVLFPLDRLLSQASTSGSPSTKTDFSGSYELWSVKPGRYVVDATLDGYSDDLKLALPLLGNLSIEDKKRILAAFPQVTVKPGASAREDLVLRRGAAISGRVSVDFGGVPNKARVIATQIPGEQSSSDSSARIGKSEPFTQFSMTDDRGVYRIAGLPAGKYRISIRITEAFFGMERSTSGEFLPKPERPGTAELVVYAPEALRPDSARVVDVRDGDEVTDADITIPTRSLHSIGGIVTAGGAPRAGVAIDIQPPSPEAVIRDYEAVSMPDGAYRFDLLPPGTYILRGKPTGSTTALTGEISVQLQGNDILDANIDLHPQTGATARHP